MARKEKEKPFFYGGQAVMEGVMMRGKTAYALAVRKPNGEITVITKALSQKKGFMQKVPILRGMAAFVEAIRIGMKTMMQSAEIAADGLEETEKPSRFEQFLANKLGDKLNDVLIQISLVMAVALAILLFVLLPLWLGSGFVHIGGPVNLLGLVEGVARLLIFLAYVLLISRSKDIRRVFQYHGAEHKVINGHENGAPLTVEGILGYSRLHNRCGTSFLLVVMLISVLVFLVVRVPNPWLRLVSRLVLIPVIAGLSYEVIKWAGRSKGKLVKVISFPGLCLQRLTTGEPDEPQIETALAALQRVLDVDSGKPIEEETAETPLEESPNDP